LAESPSDASLAVVSLQANKANTDEIMLYPGGVPFGIRFYTKGVMVIDISEVIGEQGKSAPAAAAGLMANDVIQKVNDTEIHSVEQVTDFVKNSDGKPIELVVVRGESKLNLSLTPAKSLPNGEYRAGMWIKDSAAGIGTMTFFDPRDNSFGGLGHGICDPDSGDLLPLNKGIVTDVKISGITKGEKGTPGVIRGYIASNDRGRLTGNFETGVYGFVDEQPKNLPEGPLPIAKSNEIEEGAAYIWTTLDNSIPRKYEINIVKANAGNGMVKNFVIQVTDPALLEQTGGIVQGMSGSPIIQNGKIIGAVTHVLLNDPTSGYGIYIENMLAKIPQELENAA